MRDEAGFRGVRHRSLDGASHRLALLLTASETAAQDLVQVTLEKAYVAWPQISALASPDAYVRRIMVNTLISTQRLAWKPSRGPHAPSRRSTASRRPRSSVLVDHELLVAAGVRLPDRGSGRSWCCATTRTCPSVRSPSARLLRSAP